MSRCWLLCLMIPACASSSDAGSSGGATHEVVADGDAGDAGDAGTGIGAVDGASSNDGASACARCRADQLCVGGKCAFACSGMHVPGDYPSIQAAIDALASADADASICLGEQTYSEAIQLRNPAHQGRALSIMGLDAARTKIAGTVYYNGQWATASLKGLWVDGGVSNPAVSVSLNYGGKVTVTAAHLTGFRGLFGEYVEGALPHNDATFVIDGCELSGSGVPNAILIDVSGAAAVGHVRATVQNSWFHDSYIGAAFGGEQQPMDVTFVNNTIAGCAMGVNMAGGT